MPSVFYDLVLCDPYGNPVVHIGKWVNLGWNLAVNDVGSFSLQLPPHFDRKLVGLDYILEIWRRPIGGINVLEASYFVRKWNRAIAENGQPVFQIDGVSPDDLLKKAATYPEAGGDEVREIKLYNSRLNPTNDATKGFKIAYGGKQSAIIKWEQDATITNNYGAPSANAVETAIQGISTIGSGNATVEREGNFPNFTYTVTFTATLGQKNIPNDVTGALTVPYVTGGTGGYTANIASFTVNTVGDGASPNRDGRADDLMKAYVRENMGQLAAANRDISFGMSVAPNYGLGWQINVQEGDKELLIALQDIATANLNADPTSVDVFFQIVQVDFAPAKFEFRTYYKQRGADRTFGSANPILLSVENGTLTSASIEYDFTDYKTTSIVMGHGNGRNRLKKEVTDTQLQTLSPWGRREMITDAGDSKDIKPMGKMEIEGRNDLYLNRPHQTFQANISKHLKGMIYGVDYRYGDRMSAQVLGEYFPIRIDGISVTVDESGNEKVDARLSWHGVYWWIG